MTKVLDLPIASVLNPSDIVIISQGGILKQVVANSFGTIVPPPAVVDVDGGTA